MTRPPRRRTAPPRPRGRWKHGPIPVIGLVGGIGAGKSAVAGAMAAHGALVLDADAIGHVLLQQRPARELVLRRFGDRVLDRSAAAEDGTPPIDRRALGRLVFADPGAKKDLEAILHPRMRRTFEKAIARTARARRAPAVVLDAAVLFEAGWNALCDRVVFVDAPADVRLARVQAQRGWDADTLAARERAQAPLDEKRRRADLVLDNQAEAEALRAEVDRLWPALIRPPRARRSAAGPPLSDPADARPRR